jgi:pimeloyl-[acyl-carrier protein] synthase
MTEQQVVNTGLLMIAAGMQTTKHAIANSIVALIRHPDALEQLASDHHLIPSAVEECLRYDGPSQAVGRVTTTEMQLSGVKLAKGSFLRLAVASANRDPQHFDQPDAINIRRQPNLHLALGFGSHACIGAQLAKLATRVAICGLLRRFQKFSIVAGTEERELYSSLRGFSRLQIVGYR